MGTQRSFQTLGCVPVFEAIWMTTPNVRTLASLDLPLHLLNFKIILLFENAEAVKKFGND